ncbi:hypothetical protein ZWY2020_039675 [Hordeum vulgare]|nr:hypothetical protein ZWY2020_039675 [Hordeum vulgare]
MRQEAASVVVAREDHQQHHHSRPPPPEEDDGDAVAPSSCATILLRRVGEAGEGEEPPQLVLLLNFAMVDHGVYRPGSRTPPTCPSSRPPLRPLPLPGAVPGGQPGVPPGPRNQVVPARNRRLQGALCEHSRRQNPRGSKSCSRHKKPPGAYSLQAWKASNWLCCWMLEETAALVSNISIRRIPAFCCCESKSF